MKLVGQLWKGNKLVITFITYFEEITLDGFHLDIDQDTQSLDGEDDEDVDEEQTTTQQPYDTTTEKPSKFQRRQTGEEFSSDASPDCRVSFNPSASGCSRRRNFFPLSYQRGFT